MLINSRKTLPLLIALALAQPAAWAQEDNGEDNGQDEGKEKKSVPTLYTTVDEVSVYLIQPDGTQVDVDTGETVVMTQDSHRFVDRPPSFLEWPCGTSLAEGRGSSETFTLEDLESDNVIAQVVQRWFDNREVLSPRARWLNYEAHTTLSFSQIEDYVDPAHFWYRSGPATEKMTKLRPRTLMIGLFYGTGQVVVDTNHLDELRQEYGDEAIPVVFEYQDETVVPVSYFGAQLDPVLLMNTFLEFGVRAADVPWQFAGDYHADMPTGQLIALLDPPALAEIDEDRRAKLERELQERGFKAKPINLSVIAGAEGIMADEVEKIRVAESLGFDTIPVQFIFYSDTSAAQHCGVAPPIGAVGALGTSLTTSGGPRTGAPPEPPQEIRPPDPPQPEQPVSRN